MSESTTKPEDHDTVQDLVQLVEDSLTEAKQAYAQLARERQDKVRLEKVASELQNTPEVSTSVVERTVDLLIEHNYIDENQREKLASEIVSNPENILRLTNRIIEISVPSYSEGRGVPKAASEEKTPSDLDGWAKVASQGA